MNGDNQVTSLTFQNRVEQEFYSGFFQSGYTYYIVANTTSSNDELHIVRVCKGTAESGNIDFNNQYEVVLGCDGNCFFAPTIKGVSVLNGETLPIAITLQGPPSTSSNWLKLMGLTRHCFNNQYIEFEQK